MQQQSLFCAGQDGAGGAYSGLHAVRGGERGVRAQASGHHLPLPPSSGSVQVRQTNRYIRYIEKEERKKEYLFIFFRPYMIL
jgi:hypothetical protein